MVSKVLEWNGITKVIRDSTPEDDAVQPPIGYFRNNASLNRMIFATRAVEHGFVSYDAAAQWAAGNEVPTKLQAVIDALPKDQRGPALMWVLSAPNIDRNDQLMPLIIEAFETDDEGVDALYNIG